MSVRVRIDPTACSAHGLCAELLPELIAQDDWGYPIVRPESVPGHLEQMARRARDLCPALAVHLEAMDGARSSTAS